MRRKLFIALSLALLTGAVYFPVHQHEFVLFDDPQFVTDNAEVNAGLTWHGLRWACTKPLLANWHPVTTLSHMLDCELFGVDAGAHHLVSAGFHAVNAALLFLVLVRMTGATWRSAVVAALFALHPLRVESVAWVAERKDVLSGFFGLLCLMAYAAYVQSRERGAGSGEQGAGSGEQGAGREERGAGSGEATRPSPPAPLPSDGRGWRRRGRSGVWYTVALVCFALGLMSKPMVVTLPFILLLLDFWPLGRFTICDLRFKIWKLAGEKIPFFALAGVFCGITLYLQQGAGAVAHMAGLTWMDRIANAIVSYVLYLGKLFWPLNLAVIYPHPARTGSFFQVWAAWQVGLMALLLIAFSVLCWLQQRRRPYLAVGWIWYLGSLLPVIGLVQVGEQAMADRYTYLPLIGPVIALVWLVADAAQNFQLRRFILPALSAMVVAACAVLTNWQVAVWQNTITLFEHAARVTTDNASAEFGLATGFDRAGQATAAMLHYRAAVRIDPFHVRARNNLGLLLEKQNHWTEAAEQFAAILETNPDDLPARLNLADAQVQLGQNAEAIANFEHVLRLTPDSMQALNNLAWLLATSPSNEVRNGPRAVELAERACAVDGFKRVVFIGTLAAAYAEARRFDEAVATAQRAVKLAEDQHDAALAATNRRLLELYRKGQAFHEEEADGPKH